MISVDFKISMTRGRGAPAPSQLDTSRFSQPNLQLVRGNLKYAKDLVASNMATGIFPGTFYDTGEYLHVYVYIYVIYACIDV